MTEGDNSNLMSRRQFLKGGAATAAAIATSTWAEKAEAQVDSKRNVLDILKQYQFSDNDGKPIEYKKLEEQIKGKDITLTFGFRKCKGVCPITNRELAEVDAKQKDLWHVIISTDPDDNKNQANRDEFMDKVKKAGMNAEQTIILHVSDPEALRKMQTAFGARIAPPPPGHTPLVFLHDKQGKQIEVVDGRDSKASETLINALNAKGMKR